MLLVNIILGSSGQILMKIGTRQMGSIDKNLNIASGVWNTFVNIFSNPQILLGLSLYAVSAVIWLRILRQVNLSFAYPMMSFSYVVVVILSALILGEKVPSVTIIGLIFITLGVSLIGFGYSAAK